MCGSTKSITRHHVLNREWNPQKNYIIPICGRCHKFIHKLYPDKLDKLHKFIDTENESESVKNLLRELYKIDKQLHKTIRQKIRWKENYHRMKIKNECNGSNWVRFK